MSTTIQQLLGNYCATFAGWLLPYSCVICSAETQESKMDLCQQCQTELPWISNACSQCANPLPHKTHSNYCGRCLRQPPPFDCTIALFHYQDPVSHLISNLKFHNKLIYADIFGKLVTQKLAKHYQGKNKPELIIPVPLHRKRLIERGYNQALELSRPIAKHLKIPIDYKSTQRIRATQPQSSISANKRKDNIKNAFGITPHAAPSSHAIKAKHILVVDDVITTGETTREFCRILRKSGVEHIDLCAVARTSRGVV